MNNLKSYEVQLVCQIEAANEADAKLKALAYPILNLVELRTRELTGTDVPIRNRKKQDCNYSANCQV